MRVTCEDDQVCRSVEPWSPELTYVKLILPLQSVPRPAYHSPDAMPAREVAATVKPAPLTLCAGAVKTNLIGAFTSDGPPAGATVPAPDRARAPWNCAFTLSPLLVLTSASTSVLPPGTRRTV